MKLIGTDTIFLQKLTCENFRFDVALLWLDEVVDLGLYTPVCLPQPGEKFVGETAVALGETCFLVSLSPNSTLLELWIKKSQNCGFFFSSLSKYNLDITF